MGYLADSYGKKRFVVMEHKGDLHPQVVVEDPNQEDVFSAAVERRASAGAEPGS